MAAELRRLGPRLSALSERDRDTAVGLARGAVAKLLHEPIVRLRALSGPSPGDGRDGAAGALAELFGIDAAPKFDGA